MRGGGNPDAIQAEIVDVLRRCGCRVAITSRLGKGFPDLLVGTPRNGRLLLLELKAPGEKLNPAQAQWHAEWQWFPLFTVRSVEEALDAIAHDCTSFDIDRLGKKTCSECGRRLTMGAA